MNPVNAEHFYKEHNFDGSHASVTMTGDLNMGGYSILNALGIGGPGGKATRYCSTAAEIIAACQDADVGRVYICPGTYTFSATIAPTSYTHIIGIGHVQLDWSGAVSGVMFQNAAATYVTYENLHWVKTGNIYLPLVGYNGTKIIRCRQDYTGNLIYLFPASYVNIIDSDLSYVRFQGGSHTVISGGSIAFRLELLYTTELSVTNCRVNAMQITDYHTYSTHLRAKFTNVDFICTADAYANTCIYIYTGATSLHTIYGLHFVNCNFEPLNNGDDCILLENDANLGVADMAFSHCEFYDALNVYTIPANPTVARWRFTQNRYESIAGTVYNFTDVPSFHYVEDGD